MFEWLFGKKKEVERMREDTRKSFEAVKNDMGSLSAWVKHLNERADKHDFLLKELDSKLSSIDEELEGIKNAMAFENKREFKQLFKTPGAVWSKQTGIKAVQEAVQTPVQTGVLPELSMFSITERAIILVLLNADLKLSYDDLAAMLGKNRATIRGQINSIKQKSELLQEEVEKNGKKRVYIPEEIKEKMLKSVKVRVSKEKKSKKEEEKEEEYD